jgi:hypothetical protein
MAHKEESKDPRAAATASVWGIACGVLGISIPLIAITHGSFGLGYLPLVGVIGAAVSTAAIWLSPHGKPTPQLSAQELDDIKDGLLDIHDHVGALERRLDDQELRLRIAQANTDGTKAGGIDNAPQS